MLTNAFKTFRIEQWNFAVNKKKDLKFWIFVIFNETFLVLTVQMNYANEWVYDLIASQFSMYFVYEIVKIFIFSSNM